MKKKNKIDQNSINDIIKFSERENGTDSEVSELYEPEDSDLVFDGDSRVSRKGIIIGVAIGIAAIIVFFSIDLGFFGNYKNNFSNNFSSVFGNFTREEPVEEHKEEDTSSQYRTKIKSSVIVSPDSASEAEYEPYKSGVICAVTNHMSYIDSDGHVVWEMDTAVVDPILSVEGNYILLAEKGGNKLCLYSDRRLLYDVDDPDSIKTAKVSSNGDVAAVTDRSAYRGGISVYNKSGAQIYSWISGGDAVICADISASSRRVAVSLLNTETSAKSTVELFDINKTESYVSVDIDNAVIFDLSFTGDTLSAFGDNRLVTISEKGKVLSDIEFFDGQLMHSAADDKGNKLLSLYDGNMPSINAYGKRGTLHESLTLTGIAGNIDINGRTVLYNIGRDAYFGKIGSKSMTKYNATMDIKKLIIVSDKTFAIIYANSFEIVNV